MPLSVGTPAPDFSLLLKPGEAPLRLSDYRGEKKVVLLFFPLAFSGTCTAEMCAVAENYGAWTELNAEVIGISIDSPYVNQKFAEETGATFPILSDFNKETAPKYDALLDEVGGMKGVTDRIAYVIGTDGVISYAWKGEHPGLMPPMDEIMEAVAQAK
jgi:glutaredoxin-dependent peroxiredoxin